MIDSWAIGAGSSQMADTLAYDFPPLPEKKEGWEEWDKAHYVVNRWMVGCGGDPSLGHSPI